MEYTLNYHGDYRILEVLIGINVYNIGEFKKKLFKIIEEDEGNLVVFLRNNEHFDSSVISALISAHKKVTTRKSKFGLIISNPEILDLFHLAGLGDFFLIYKSLEELK